MEPWDFALMLLVCTIIWLFLSAVIVMVVGMRSAVSAFIRPSVLYKEWNTSHPADQVVRSILNGVLYATSGYRVEHISEDASSIIISSGITWVSWGMFYQISVSSVDAQHTTIRVAVASKFPQWNVIVLRQLEKCVGFVEATLLAQPREYAGRV